MIVHDARENCGLYGIVRAMSKWEAESKVIDHLKQEHDLDGASDEHAGFRALITLDTAKLIELLRSCERHG